MRHYRPHFLALSIGLAVFFGCRSDHSPAPEPSVPSLTTAKITYKSTVTMTLMDQKTTVESGVVRTFDIAKNKMREEITGTLPSGVPRAMVNLYDGQTQSSFSLSDPSNVRQVPWAASATPGRYAAPPQGSVAKGKETVLGRSCDVYEIGSSKIWIWNGLLVKEELTGTNVHRIFEATAIEENISVDPSLFSWPTSARVETLDSVVKRAEESAGAANPSF